MIDLDAADLSALEAVLETDKGTMRARFFPEEAPNHVRNFLDLAQKGFYDGTAFHRVIRGFMIQGGCPNTRAGARGAPGTGGPGHKIAAEFNARPHRRGTLSMARSAHPDSAGSQFFVVHGEHIESLDGNYTVFGELVDGLDVLDAIASVEVEFGSGGERSKPTQRVGLRSVRVRPATGGAEAES
jgi:peptidyl-prolyl cis-trans isomerase B (cyclophilin B)